MRGPEAALVHAPHITTGETVLSAAARRSSATLGLPQRENVN
jgi:hypothetical protein